MKARELIDNAAFGPQELKAVFQAFDAAWENIAGNFGDDPSVVEAARTRLANLVLAIARNGASDSATIKNAALQAFALEYKVGGR